MEPITKFDEINICEFKEYGEETLWVVTLLASDLEFEAGEFNTKQKAIDEALTYNTDKITFTEEIYEKTSVGNLRKHNILPFLNPYSTLDSEGDLYNAFMDAWTKDDELETATRCMQIVEKFLGRKGIKVSDLYKKE
jgi:hypothetical protein